MSKLSILEPLNFLIVLNTTFRILLDKTIVLAVLTPFVTYAFFFKFFSRFKYVDVYVIILNLARHPYPVLELGKIK